MSDSNVTLHGMEHLEDCLMIRYLDQPDKEHWPSGFSGRYQLCTCPAHPDAEAKDAAFAQALAELREFLEHGRSL